MLKMTTTKWKKLLVWVAGYANVLTFALVGGYFMLKDEDEDVKYSAKWAFLANLVFLAFTAFLSVISHIGGACNWYGSWIYKFHSGLSLINNVGRIAVFVTCALFAVFKETPWKAWADIQWPWEKWFKKEEETVTATEETTAVADESAVVAETAVTADTAEQPAKETETKKARKATKSEIVREFFDLVSEASKGTKSEEDVATFLKGNEELGKDLKQACALTEENGNGSMSYLQRRMSIGYVYAGSIIEGFINFGILKSTNSAVNTEKMDSLKKYLG